jgi:hypothetical protein
MASWWRRLKISAAFHLSSRRDSLSHAATRVIRRKTNRRHMIGDHHGRASGRATLLVRAVDEIPRHAQAYARRESDTIRLLILCHMTDHVSFGAISAVSLDEHPRSAAISVRGNHGCNDRECGPAPSSALLARLVWTDT